MMCNNISRQGMSMAACQAPRISSMPVKALDLSAPLSQQADQLPLTWMLRNLHRKHTVDSLHAHFQNAGVDSRLYNMLYIPFDNRKKANARYAFINFVNDEAVKQVIGKLHAEFGSDRDGKPSVLPANIQGVEASISEYVQRHQGRPSAKQQLLLLYEGHRIGTKTALLLYSDRHAPASIQNWRPDFDVTDDHVFSQEKLSMMAYDSALRSPGNSKLDMLDPETRSTSTTASSPYSEIDTRMSYMENSATYMNNSATYMEMSAVGETRNVAPPMPRTILQERGADLYNSRTTIDHYHMARAARETPVRSVFRQDRDAGPNPEVFLSSGAPLPSEVPIPGERLLKTQDQQRGSFMANSRYISMGYL
jgi:hypothetical protein